APLLDLVAARPELDLTVVYAARTVADRSWSVRLAHRAVFLRGVSVPGLRGHDYPVTPGIWRALRRARPDCVVVSGWSTFAAQAAIAWCRTRRVPYLLLVESHDAGPKAVWRRAVKRAVVPPLVRGAAGLLVVGSLARESVLAQGADPARVRVFANTVDVSAYAARADALAGRREELRAGLGVLLRAAARARDGRLAAVLVGVGPERGRLDRLAGELGVRAILAGGRSAGGVLEAYAAADVFCLLSTHEPWGVVVNEAAACGLPLVLSDRVGAAADLLRDGENGVLVPAGDVDAAAAALRAL